MIFDMQGVPLNIALMDLGLRLFERKANPPPKRPRAQRYTSAVLRAIRKERGVGRPVELLIAPTMKSAIKMHGGKQAALAALEAGRARYA